MKKPLIIIIALVIGIVATNSLMTKKSNDVAQDAVVQDTIETSQAADIPL